MKEVKIYTIVSEQLSPPITGESFCTDMVRHSDYADLEEKCAALAAENARMTSFINAYLDIAIQGGALDGFDVQELALKHGLLRKEEYCAEKHRDMVYAADLKDGDDVYFRVENPATDAFLAEVRASAIPDGYVLVPQQIFLEPSDIELICSQCGDGHESGYGDFTDGLLWVGNIQRDDGSIVHGLHISSADYTEEGGVTVCEFAAQPRKGGAV
ncbi:hypothetical protein ZX23_19875 [Salmonella enterica subsp. enterica serovar Brandenburg]|nr:hypothetical protein [Salmonella enterica subsp. enterica serovar Brandenburg]